MVVGIMELPATAGEVRGVVEEEYFDHRVVPKLVEYLRTQGKRDMVYFSR